MEISPLEIYFIMQADSIVAMAKGLIFFPLTLIVFSAIFNLVTVGEDTVEAKSMRDLANKAMPISLICLLVLALVASLTPSSKTLAVMYLVPEVMSNESITHEAKEIYSLMKEGLTDLVKDDE